MKNKLLLICALVTLMATGCKKGGFCHHMDSDDDQDTMTVAGKTSAPVLQTQPVVVEPVK